MRQTTLALAALAGLLAAAGCARPPEPPPVAAVEPAPPLPPEAGWLAASLIGRPVTGADGEEIGRVDDVVVTADGTVEALAVTLPPEAEDAAPATVLLPWRVLGRAPDGAPVLDVPDAAALRAMAAPEAGGPGTWRARDMIGGIARLEGGTPWGLVRDLALAGDGVVAVVVDPALGYSPGVRLFPYEAERADPGTAMAAYRLPLAAGEIDYPDVYAWSAP